jgi:hypothetical protein
MNRDRTESLTENGDLQFQAGPGHLILDFRGVRVKNSLMGDQKHTAKEIYGNRSFDKRHCFLCGVRLGKKNTSREHIFPKFVLHEFNLWEQHITLINSTTMPYRKVVIPCCRECNNEHIGRLDKKIATALRAGFSTFKKLDQAIVFQWLSRILYCILYLELISPRDPRFKRRKIVKKEFFGMLHTVFLFLNSIRVKTKFHRPYPWSLFVFKTQIHPKKELNFDFKDNPFLLTVAIRMNDVGIVGVLQDNGAVGSLHDKSLGIDDARKLELHPIQFSEVAARIFYAASLINRVPKYMTISSPEKEMEVVALPLQGLSSKPVFNSWKIEDYARLLSWSCHLPAEQLYFPGQGILTFLRDEGGKPKHIKFDGS